MKQLGRWMRVSMLALASALGCGGHSPDGTRIGGETNWLVSCSADDDCELGQCLCGVCTLACNADATCGDGPAGSHCASGSELPLSCEAEVGGGICVTTEVRAALSSNALSSKAPVALLDATLRTMVRDLESLPAEDQRFIRYLTVVNLRNAEPGMAEQGLAEPGAVPLPSDDELERRLTRARLAETKLANSLSFEPLAAVPASIDAAQLIQRIDLRAYGWVQTVSVDGALYADGWDAIVAQASFAVEYQGPAADRLRALTGARVPWLFADDFVAAAAMGETYYELLALPRSIADLKFRLARLRNLNQGSVYRAAFENSGISLNARVVERAEIGRGYWQAYDFATDARGAAVFADPMGFSADGTEVLFTLPNGLYGYFMAGADGQRVVESALSPAAVWDPAQPGGVLRNAVSCFSCHSAGLIPFTDELRGRWTPSPGAELSAEQAAVLDAYPESRLLELLRQDDSEDFLVALERAGVPRHQADDVSRLYLDFQADVTSARAAGVLSVTPEFLARRQMLLPEALRMPDPASGSIPRAVFIAEYLEALCNLQQASENRPAACP